MSATAPCTLASKLINLSDALDTLLGKGYPLTQYLILTYLVVHLGNAPSTPALKVQCSTSELMDHIRVYQSLIPLLPLPLS